MRRIPTEERVANDKATERAIRAGRAEAAAVVGRREKVLRRRAAEVGRQQKALAAEQRKALARARGRAGPARLAPIAPRLQARAGPPSVAGVLVAEGDSWFDYPFVDVLSVLEDDFAFDIESVSHKGDRVEDMAYEGGQLDELTRRIEKLLRRGVVPRAILLSGGGNDVAGDEFGMLLNHATSAKPGLNEQVVAGVIDERVRLAYAFIIGGITRVCELQLGRRVPILTHGYDYSVPDGRGFFGGWWLLPGPWLQPGFRQKGFRDLPTCAGLVKRLIDRFNEMLLGLARAAGMEHVHHVDLRKTLSSGPSYKADWDNELHPTRKGFELVAAKFNSAIAALPLP